ncbi:Uncharacterized conserved protein YecE, DUF72 family [Devosia lucknowensis]|uniref:Uncharacterized conserved protein YecE, DUF72 family n=1 Tax=Devosia lucknowensis TaxID=1096929 RepID=A0A1Y6G822_9HYPH|nr:DUF72 domain-containing protein [Devosia lucknowensis]SMQ86301.1 Uncharacterized conserved protein YecE, DUF72 family [Devosia lucknowensis]
MGRAGIVRTGTAGWVYEPWRGTFFPEGLVQKKELSYAASRLTSIEINATFRANQKPASFQRWASETTEGFQFSVKGPQLVTHIKRLKGGAEPLANFFASGPLALGDRLGPFVWQLPPNLAFDPQSLAAFLELLPKTVDDYVALADKADRTRQEPFLDPTGVQTIRHAIEPRHPSFKSAEADALLRQHNVARVIADTEEFPSRDLTADFAYLRLQGPSRPGAEGYGDADIDDWAHTIGTWRDGGKDVYAYFVHEDKLHAPSNAIALRKALGIALPGD